MALTLVEAMKSATNPMSRGVIETFARNSGVLSRAVLQQIVGSAYSYSQEGALPGIEFRSINGAYAESTGIINPQVEPLKICGGDSDVDRALVRTRPQNSIGDLRASYLSMKVKALSLGVEDRFFNGNSSTTPQEFDGLKTRLIGSQLIAMGATNTGDVLTLAKVDELLDAVDGADVLYMNRTMRRKMNVLIRAAGQAFEVVSDAFGRQVLGYAGVPIEVTGIDETGAEILAFDEAPSVSGGTSVSTSLYAVKWGADRYCAILENPAGIEVNDLGELQSAPKYRTRVEWIMGMAVFSGRAAARLYGCIA